MDWLREMRWRGSGHHLSISQSQDNSCDCSRFQEPTNTADEPFVQCTAMSVTDGCDEAREKLCIQTW